MTCRQVCCATGKLVIKPMPGPINCAVYKVGDLKIISAAKKVWRRHACGCIAFKRGGRIFGRIIFTLTTVANEANYSDHGDNHGCNYREDEGQVWDHLLLFSRKKKKTTGKQPNSTKVYSLALTGGCDLISRSESKRKQTCSACVAEHCKVE